MSSIIPIVLFAYARPDHLRRTLDCLRENHVPLIYAFSDAPRTPDKAPAVDDVRRMLRSIDWCEVRLTERSENLGLGKSILTGVTEVFKQHEALVVFEDDLICVPGTYDYLCAALEHYRDDPRVMSVTGWTHPRITPANVTDQPYFDGRAECWVWGTWRRAWAGMETDAKTLMEQCRAQGIDIYRYGADLVDMAEHELSRNIWAVRLIYHHILHGGLAFRPPHSMVEHIGFDAQATNFVEVSGWANASLWDQPVPVTHFPPAVLHQDCPRLWRQAFPRVNYRQGFMWRVVRKLRQMASITSTW